MSSRKNREIRLIEFLTEFLLHAMEQSNTPTLSNYTNTINLWATCQWYNNYAGKN